MLELIEVKSEPISLQLAWAHLNIDAEGSPESSPFDYWLEQVGIPAAREAAENFTGLELARKEYRLLVPSLRGGITIPVRPFVSVLEIGYRDADGVDQTVGTGGFDVDQSGEFAVVTVDGEPETDGAWDAVSLEFEAGYTNPPAAATQAMLLILGHMFRNREAVSDKQAVEVPIGVEYLLRPLRVRLGMA